MISAMSHVIFLSVLCIILMKLISAILFVMEQELGKSINQDER